jgi:hypothetical protein
MKSDTEIKEWIDSREVLTQNELCEFFGIQRQAYRKAYKPLYRWWNYVLKTKNLTKLRLHISNKRRATQPRPDKKIILSIILKYAGAVSRWGMPNLIREKYGIRVSSSCIYRYAKELNIAILNVRYSPYKLSPAREKQGQTKKRVMEVFKQDKRVSGVGYKKAKAYLNNIYDIKLGETAVYYYLKEFKLKQQTNVK